MLVDFFHPQERTLGELERVHLDLIHAREHRHEVASEQPEIMEVRQPRHQPVLGCAAFDGPQGADVRNEVAVREARALGHTRAAGGELEHGGIVMLRDVAVVLLEIDDAGLRDEVFADLFAWTLVIILLSTVLEKLVMALIRMIIKYIETECL